MLRYQGTHLRLVAAGALIATVCLSLTPTPALADDVRIRDRNDTRGPFDIRSTDVEHSGTSITHRIRMFDPIGSIDARYHAVAVGFDTDGNRSDFERILFFYSRTLGTHQAVMTNGSGRRVLSRPDVTMPSADTIEARFGIGALRSNLTSYRWFAFVVSPDPSNDRCCVDTAPDRGWVHHDLAPPFVDGPTFSDVEDQVMRGVPVAATFKIGDVGGSGPGVWQLQTRDMTVPGPWTDVATGSGRGPHVVDVPALEGHTYSVCVVAADNAGNEVGELSRFTVPFDDAGSMFSYSGSWTAVHEPDDFMGTRHVGVIGDSIDITTPLSGDILAFVLPGGFDGVARLTSDSTDYGTFTSAGGTGSRLLISITSGGTVAGKVFHVEIESGTFAIDGFQVGTSFFDPSDCTP